MTLTTTSLTTFIALSALTITVIGIYIWKKNKNYARVGSVKKLLFYPVKSLKAVDVTRGKCTKLGFEVNGLLDRSFMLVTEEGILVSQEEIPSLVLLTPQVRDNYMIINGPDVNPLKIEIKSSPSPGDKIIPCKVHGEEVGGVDCGDEVASWFQSAIKKENIRLVRFYSSLTVRKSLKNNPVWNKMREKYPVGFQEESGIHLLSQSSIDDLNSKVTDQKVSVYNFRPNILIEGCKPYAEDSWQYMKFNNTVELTRLKLTGRCIITTNDPEKAIMSQKEPLVTLRKYRISEDPKLKDLMGSVPCLGTNCAVISSGDIVVGDNVFAVVDQMPKMKNKLTQ